MTQIKREKIIFDTKINNVMMIKFVKSTNLCKSVIQISYDIIKAHGGDLSMESEADNGAEFIIKIPLTL